MIILAASQCRCTINTICCIYSIATLWWWMVNLFETCRELFTYLLTARSRVLLEKLTGSAASQEILRILWNPKAHYLTHKCSPPLPILSQLHPVPTTPPTSWRSVLMLSYHLRLGLPSGLLPSGFPTRTLCTPLPSPHKRHIPRPSHSSRFYHPHNIG